MFAVVFLMSGVRTIKSFLTHRPVLYAAQRLKRLERKSNLFLLGVKMLELLQNLVIGSSFKQDCAIAEVCRIARVKM